jgi:3-methyladenine DNA glycosylase AlkD
VEQLLHSAEHEFRLTALLIWVDQFKRGDEATQRGIYQFYLANTRWVNNWDLVDTSAAGIVGAWTETRDREVLDRLAVSESLWERRIAIISTLWFINLGQSEDTLRIADMLLHDQHDLIHKATGWMLREVGKRCSQEVLEAWLKPRYQTMPRTMLRYAIERFEPGRRQAYLKGAI